MSDEIMTLSKAGRNGGEYYTPRPLIKTIVKVVAPIIGNKIYDGSVGSAGFLVEAFEYLATNKNLTTKDAETLQKKTFYRKEKKSLAYIGIMNMILHGIEAPNIVHTNTLAENLADIQEKDLAEFVALQKIKADSENSWSINVTDIDATTYDLSVKNPHKKDETALRTPQEIRKEMQELDKESAEIMNVIEGLL